MSTPCNKYEDVSTALQIIVSSGLLDILANLDLEGDDVELVLSRVFGDTWGMLGQPDLRTSEQPDPFTFKENVIKYWIDHRPDGSAKQWNAKITSGPDRGIHRFYDFNRMRPGQTGITRTIRGKEYRGVDEERPPDKRYKE